MRYMRQFIDKWRENVGIGDWSGSDGLYTERKSQTHAEQRVAVVHLHLRKQHKENAKQFKLLRGFLADYVARVWNSNTNTLANSSKFS